MEVNPDCPAVHLWKALAHLWNGQHDEAQHDKTWAALERASPFTLLVEETRAILYAKQKQTSAAEEALKQFEAGIDKNARAILSLVRITAALGRIDDAYAWLDRAFEERVVGLVLINVDPAYDPLRSDPRFDRFLNRMGLH